MIVKWSELPGRKGRRQGRVSSGWARVTRHGFTVRTPSKGFRGGRFSRRRVGTAHQFPRRLVGGAHPTRRDKCLLGHPLIVQGLPSTSFSSPSRLFDVL